MTTPLKPCPFCGSRAEVGQNNDSGRYCIYCVSCLAETPFCRTQKNARAAWNHRPGEAAVAEECARIAERAMDGIVGAEIAMNIRSRFGGKA